MNIVMMPIVPTKRDTELHGARKEEAHAVFRGDVPARGQRKQCVQQGYMQLRSAMYATQAIMWLPML